jgi:hypothetical protein
VKLKLKLEHRKQKVVSFSIFIIRMLRFSIFAIVLIILSVGFGVVGYHYFANLGWLDSFHMACLILNQELKFSIHFMRFTVALLF